MMLNIQSVGLLAQILETTPGRLIAVADSASTYYEDLVLVDPAKPEKRREVVNVTGALRTFQNRLYQKLLVPRHQPSFYSHGGVRGRHIKTNASPHLGSAFVITRDIASFYPSVHFSRVYRLFEGEFGCSPDVARVCTKLCTYRFHLALGLITSPIIADCLMMGVDHRIGEMCRKHGLVYTRFVDDLTISGSYPIDSGSFPELVAMILRENGFRLNLEKEDEGRLSEGKLITKLRIKRGRLDVSPEYLAEVNRQLDSAALLAKGGEWAGIYYTQGQVYGRIQFIAWVNAGRRRELIRKYSSISWKVVEVEAQARGLVVSRKKLVTPDAKATTTASTP